MKIKKRTKYLNKCTIKTKLSRLRAVDIQNIRLLAEQLGGLIPLDGYRSSFSLKVLVKERKLQKFLGLKNNKKEVFVEFVKKMLQNNKHITFKKLIRESLPRAIERRHNLGDPVLKSEADALASTLNKLGINLTKEIAELKLPNERPKIVPPPHEIKMALKNFGLHPALIPQCLELFLDGYINESVRKALEKFETTVQKLAGDAGRDGAELMGSVFNERSPVIKINNQLTIKERNEQEGYKLIAMGMMRWWRNELSHGDMEQLPHQEAMGRIMLVSNMFHLLDQRPS
jgi:uncharacterized protein (TIGR02391 family)